MKLILTYLFCTFSLYFTAQTPEWAYAIGGSDLDICKDIEVDRTKNLYLTGGVSNTVDFDLSNQTQFLSLPIANRQQIFVCKYDSLQALQLAFYLEGNVANQASVIKVDSSENIYIAGIFAGQIDFDHSALSYQSNASENVFFIAKYNRFGVFQWMKQIGSAYQCSGDDIDVFIDQSNDLYVSTVDTLCKYSANGDLHWSQAAVNISVFDGKANFYQLSTQQHGFYETRVSFIDLTKIDSSGLTTFSKRIISSNSNSLNGKLYFDRSNHLLVDGVYWDSCTFSTFGNQDSLFVNTKKTMQSVGSSMQALMPDYHEYLAKFDTLGDLLWMHDFGGEFVAPVPELLETDVRGKIYAIGGMTIFKDFDYKDSVKILYYPNLYHAKYLATYDASGEFLAAIPFLTNDYLDGTTDLVAFDTTTMYVSGRITTTIDTDLSDQVSILNAAYWSDFFIAKYHPSSFEDLTSAFALGLPDPMNENALEWNVYPNPGDAEFTIFLPNYQGSCSYKLLDLQGKILRQERLMNPETSIDIHDLNPGSYLIELENHHQISVRKLVKY